MRNLIILLSLFGWYASSHPVGSVHEFMNSAKGSIEAVREPLAENVSSVIVAAREPMKQAIVAGVVDVRDGLKEGLKN